MFSINKEQEGRVCQVFWIIRTFRARFATLFVEKDGGKWFVFNKS